MSECLIIPLEGVLAADAATAYPRNVLIYSSLAFNFRTVVLTTWERDEAKRWLRTERINYDLLLDKGTSVLEDRQWRIHGVTEVMAMGWPIGLYIDVDPATVQDVLAMGLATMLLSFRVRAPNWIPTKAPPRAWDDLVTFIDEQREADGEALVDGVGRRRRSGWPGQVEAHGA
jgi:hypothetical protein